MEKTRRASAYWRQLYWYCFVMTDKGRKSGDGKAWQNNLLAE